MATDVISREAQREFPRWPIATTRPVRVDLGPAGSGQLVDISFGGMRVKLVAPLRRDAEIPVRLEIPDRPTVQCSGKVIWSKPTGAAGIHFTRMEDDQKETLKAWLSELEQSASESSPQRDEFTRITAQIAAMKLNNADALSLIARRVSQMANASGVTIALGKPETMVCLARSGEAPELGTSIPSSGLTGECVRSRKLVLCQDATTDPRAGELKQGSAVIVPLLVNTEMRGVLQVFWQKPSAFDAKTIELVEKLADAIVFVTHNVMPQRRLAVVKPLPKPATLSSAPAVTNPSDSGKIKPFPVKPLTPLSPVPIQSAPKPQPIAVEPPAPRIVEVAPLAEAVQAPSVALPPMAPPILTPLRSESTIRKPVPAAVPAPSYEPRIPASRRGLALVPVAVVIIAAASGLYFWRTHRPQPVQAAAAAVTTPAIPSTPAPTETAVTVTPTVTQIQTPAAPAPAPPVTPTPQTMAKTHADTVVPEKKAAIIETKPAEPEPMMIASGRPVERPKVEDDNVMAPSATQLGIRPTASMPGIALPTANGPAPKLAAPVAKTITGGELIQRVPPRYPQTAISQGLEGKVELKAIVTAKGSVDKVRGVSGNPILVQSAIESVRLWKYNPFKLDGQPVDKELSITLTFKIPR